MERSVAAASVDILPNSQTVTMRMVGSELPDPIGTEFGHVAQEIALGMNTKEALDNLSFRIESEDLPFFVTAYGLSYQQVAGLVFAGTIASSVVQPLFGRYADRAPAAWLMPVGISAAGVGLAVTGLFSDYWLMAAGICVSQRATLPAA